VRHNLLYPVLGERPVIPGKEDKVKVSCYCLRAIAIDIPPEETLDLLANRDKAFLVSFTKTLIMPSSSHTLSSFRLHSPDTRIPVSSSVRMMV
jgi:hypothetical protein